MYNAQEPMPQFTVLPRTAITPWLLRISMPVMYAAVKAPVLETEFPSMSRPSRYRTTMPEFAFVTIVLPVMTISSLIWPRGAIM